jgi:hypothetical protein
MKKVRMWVFLLAAVTLASTANAASIGVGVFGGASVPVVQDDNGSGNVFGVRVPVNVVPLLTIEPYFAKTSGGDKDRTIDGITYTRSGIDVTTYGANAMLTFGGALQLYPFAGIGSAKSERAGLDATTTAYNFGLGLGISPPIANLSVHLRGELDAVLEKDLSASSRKWVGVTAGVSYGLLHFPPAP